MKISLKPDQQNKINIVSKIFKKIAFKSCVVLSTYKKNQMWPKMGIDKTLYTKCRNSGTGIRWNGERGMPQYGKSYWKRLYYAKFLLFKKRSLKNKV